MNPSNVVMPQNVKIPNNRVIVTIAPKTEPSGLDILTSAIEILESLGRGGRDGALDPKLLLQSHSNTFKEETALRNMRVSTNPMINLKEEAPNINRTPSEGKTLDQWIHSRLVPLDQGIQRMAISENTHPRYNTFSSHNSRTSASFKPFLNSLSQHSGFHGIPNNMGHESHITYSAIAPHDSSFGRKALNSRMANATGVSDSDFTVEQSNDPHTRDERTIVNKVSKSRLTGM